jgi:ABC-type glycerol-3-phosphate transport system substrate-binding protein
VDRAKLAAVLGLALSLAAAGCRSSESPAGAATGGAPGSLTGRPIEVLTWWGPLGQSDPVRALINEHAKFFPDDYVISAKTQLSGRARNTIRARMMSGDPPDVFQCNVGYDMRQWVSVNGVDDRDSRLTPLDDIFPWLWTAVPPKLLDYISYQGKLYGVPATVHRVNAMFYNRMVLAAHGLAPPTTLADLKAAGRKLRAAGVPLFAISGKEPWQLGHFVFEGLLIAREGPDFYRSYFGGAEQPDDPRVVKTLQEALELLRYANTDWQDLTFLKGSELVAKGKAAISIDGDWMSVYYGPEGLTDNSVIGEGAFPGSEKTFVFTSDLFSLPVNAKNPAGAKRFLTTVESPEAQRVLTKVKGCLSPRTDVNDAGTTAIQREKAELLRRGDLALALSGIVPKQFHDDVNWALIDMGKQRNVEPALQALRSRYHLLLGAKAVQ